MRYWSYNEPEWSETGNGDILDNIVVTKSDKEILKEYREYWNQAMIHAGKNPDDYTDEDIIQDWVAINWAWESTK